MRLNGYYCSNNSKKIQHDSWLAWDESSINAIGEKRKESTFFSVFNFNVNTNQNLEK